MKKQISKIWQMFKDWWHWRQKLKKLKKEDPYLYR